MNRIRTAFAVILVALASFAQQAQESTLDRIKRVSRENLVELPAEVGGSAMPFVLDSGASSVIVDSKIAEQKNLALGETRTVSGAGAGGCNVQVVKDAVRVAGKEIRTRIVSAPLEHFARFAGITLNGVAGGSMFDSYVVTVNIANRSAVLTAPAAFRAQSTDHTLPLQRSDFSCCIVHSTVQIGETEIAGRFLIDTGAPAFGVIIGRNLARRYSQVFARRGEEFRLPGFCGTSRIAELPPATLKIAGIEIPVSMYVSLDESGAFASESFDALIGGEALRRLGTVVFNVPAQKFVIRTSAGRGHEK